MSLFYTYQNSNNMDRKIIPVTMLSGFLGSGKLSTGQQVPTLLDMMETTPIMIDIQVMKVYLFGRKDDVASTSLGAEHGEDWLRSQRRCK